MNWEWMANQGLMEGDPAWYSSGSATAEEYSHAVETAYRNATDANRKELVDMLFATGEFGGKKEYWYTDRGNEVSSLGTSAEGLFSGTGTGEKGAGARFSIAGGAELWKDTTTGTSYLVYMVPGTDDDPVYMSWTIPSDEDVQSFFGPEQGIVYNKKLTGEDALWAEVQNYGSSDDISNTSKAPFDSWASTLEVESKSQPWLLDDDYQKILAMSVLEGRVLSDAEIADTDWYTHHSEAERGWMLLFNSDPSTAHVRLADNRQKQADYLRDHGMNDLDDKLVNYMADKVTMGTWSATMMQEQTRILTDQYFEGDPLDGDFQEWMTDNGITSSTTDDKETEVRGIVKRWLGTNFGDWDDDQVGYWAGRFRNENDAQEALIETLKDQKSALFPEYDREADYETIAAPWRTMIRNQWGEMPDDSDTTLQDVIRMNNAGEAGAYLTKEGLARGNNTVVNSVQSAMNRSFGG
jgi:hypothetical protein